MKFHWHVVLSFLNENGNLSAYEWFGMEEELYQAEDHAAICLLAEYPKACSIGTQYFYVLDEEKFVLWNESRLIEDEHGTQ